MPSRPRRPTATPAPPTQPPSDEEEAPPASPTQPPSAAPPTPTVPATDDLLTTTTDPGCIATGPLTQVFRSSGIIPGSNPLLQIINVTNRCNKDGHVEVKLSDSYFFVNAIIDKANQLFFRR